MLAAWYELQNLQKHIHLKSCSPKNQNTVCRKNCTKLSSLVIISKAEVNMCRHNFILSNSWCIKYVIVFYVLSEGHYILKLNASMY